MVTTAAQSGVAYMVRFPPGLYCQQVVSLRSEKHLHDVLLGKLIARQDSVARETTVKQYGQQFNSPKNSVRCLRDGGQRLQSPLAPTPGSAGRNTSLTADSSGFSAAANDAQLRYECRPE